MSDRFCSVWPVPAMLVGLALSGCAANGPNTAAAPPLATQPTVGQEVAAVAADHLEITFPSGAARLTPEATKQLDIAARLYRDVHPVMMFSIGYTDGIGNEYDNVILSAQRARAVKQGLVARGIPADRIMIQALGTSDPVNRNDAAAPENRRAIVKWRVL